MLEELAAANRVVGVKQTRRAMASGKAAKVFFARDADLALVEPLLAQAKEAGLETVETCTMKEIGQACSIAVGAAVAAILAE